MKNKVSLHSKNIHTNKYGVCIMNGTVTRKAVSLQVPLPYEIKNSPTSSEFKV